MCVFCAASAIGSLAQDAATFTTLVNFDWTNGAIPWSMSLAQGTNGDLYGTTEAGGTFGEGTVFKITPGGTLTTVYSFCAQTGCSDGAAPLAGLVMANNGNFYGATLRGGTYNDGTLFEITPGGTLTMVLSFDGADGSKPTAPPIQGTDGNIYGTTNMGGPNSCRFGITCGTIFKITPSGVLTTLHNFNSADGSYPNGLVQGTDGNF